LTKKKAQFHVHTDKTLEALDKALDEFHAHKDIFIQLGTRQHFNFPKLHAMLHYVHSIRQFGSLDGYNTEHSERLHIDYAKEAYRASNRRNYVEQMTKWLRRQEAVHQYAAYLSWRQCSSTQSTESGPLSDDDRPGSPQTTTSRAELLRPMPLSVVKGKACIRKTSHC
jgi:hypothetical protein